MNSVLITGLILTALLWRSNWSYSKKKSVCTPNTEGTKRKSYCDLWVLFENLSQRKFARMCPMDLSHLSLRLSACNISKTYQRTFISLLLMNFY